jgi:hypothetical protein
MLGPIAALRGKVSLALAFWGYGLLGSFVVVVGPLLFQDFLEWTTYWIVWFLSTGAFVYVGLAHFAVWRCAFNVQKRVWGFVARGYVVAVVALFVWNALAPSTPQQSTIEYSRMRRAGE